MFSTFCKKPEEAKKLPQVGGYLSVNYEILDSLKPNLILLDSGIQNALAFELNRKGYNVFPFPLPQSLYGSNGYYNCVRSNSFCIR